MTPEQRADYMRVMSETARRVFDPGPCHVACVQCGLARHPAAPCEACGCYCEQDGTTCPACTRREARADLIWRGAVIVFLSAWLVGVLLWGRR